MIFFFVQAQCINVGALHVTQTGRQIVKTLNRIKE